MPKLPPDFDKQLAQKYWEFVGATEVVLPEDQQYMIRTINFRMRLLQKLNDDLANFSGDEYRVLEVGCGRMPLMAVAAHYLAQCHNKKISYLGIDINEEYIGVMRWFASEAKLSGISFIAADASQIEWFNKVDRKAFNATILMNPIVEDPMRAALEYPFNTKEQVENNPNFQAIFKQYQQFQIFFKNILPACMVPNGSLLIRTFYPQEYQGLFPLLAPMVTSLPANSKVPEDHCLMTQVGTPVKNNELTTANHFASLFTLKNAAIASTVVIAGAALAANYVKP